MDTDLALTVTISLKCQLEDVEFQPRNWRCKLLGIVSCGVLGLELCCKQFPSSCTNIHTLTHPNIHMWTNNYT